MRSNAATATGDGKRRRVLAPMRSPRAKEWMEPVGERVHEGVDVGAAVHAEEGRPSLLVVHEHSDPLRLVAQSQGGGRRCVSNVLIPVSQAHSPEAIGRADGKLPFSVDRVPDHT